MSKVSITMHVNIDDIPGKKIAPGVVERVLMRKNQGDPEGMCSAHHYTLFDGGYAFTPDPYFRLTYSLYQPYHYFPVLIAEW